VKSSAVIAAPENVPQTIIFTETGSAIQEETFVSSAFTFRNFSKGVPALAPSAAVGTLTREFSFGNSIVIMVPSPSALLTLIVPL
jgi:hypothetical protein